MVKLASNNNERNSYSHDKSDIKLSGIHAFKKQYTTDASINHFSTNADE